MGADGCSVLDAVWDAGPFASQAAFEARVARGGGRERRRDHRRHGEPGRRPRQRVREPDRVHVRRRPVLLPAADAGGVPGQAGAGDVLQPRGAACRQPGLPRVHAGRGAQDRAAQLRAPAADEPVPERAAVPARGRGGADAAGAAAGAARAVRRDQRVRQRDGGVVRLRGRRQRVGRHAGLRPGPHGGADPRRDPRRAAAGARDRAPRRADRHRRRAGDRRRGGDADRRGAGARVLLRRPGRERARGRGPLHGLRRSRSRRSRAPCPYIPLAYPGTPPSPWALVPQPLRVDAAHSPAVFLARRLRHDHADGVQPDRRHAVRRQPDGRDAGDPGGPDGDERER